MLKTVIAAALGEFVHIAGITNILSQSGAAALDERPGASEGGMEAIIHLACIIYQSNYWRRWRTLNELGFNHLSVGELTYYLNDVVFE